MRCSRKPLYSSNLISTLATFADPVAACLAPYHSRTRLADSPSLLLDVTPTFAGRAEQCGQLLRTFVFCTVKVKQA